MTKQNPHASKLFAEFGVRLIALWFDLIGVVTVAALTENYVLSPLGLGSDSLGVIILIVVFLYFVLSWASPLRATPGQLLAGIRVVSLAGEPLGIPRAALRSVVLAVLLTATWLIVDVPARNWIFLLSLLGYAAVFLAAVTPNRQGLHDMLAGSIVVTRRALTTPEKKVRLLAHVADKDPATLKQRRPRVWRTILDAILLALPAFALFSLAQVMYDRELITRTYYAYNETQRLRDAVALHYEVTSSWPTSEEQVGVPTRASYPDGGYYELEADGVIRIHFEVLPELTRGAIVLTPVAGSEGVRWKCRQDGTIVQNYLPVTCRGPSLQ